MHADWQSLIPFYITGKITPAERNALESHLTECSVCRQQLAEWRTIERAIISEVERSTSELPPLSLHLTQYGQQVHPNGFKRDERFRVHRHRRRKSASSIQILLASAACMLGGILALFLYMFISTNPSTDTGSEIRLETIVVSPSLMSPITLSPTVAPTEEPPAVISTPVVTAQVVFTATPIPTPTPAVAYADVEYACVIANAGGQSINLYSGPGTQYVVLTQIAQFNNATAVNRTDKNWYQVKYIENSAIWMGWVNANEADIFGGCSSVPIIEISESQ